MQRVKLRTGETVQVWTFGEAVPEEGGFVQDENGFVTYWSRKDGT